MRYMRNIMSAMGAERFSQTITVFDKHEAELLPRLHDEEPRANFDESTALVDGGTRRGCGGDRPLELLRHRARAVVRRPAMHRVAPMRNLIRVKEARAERVHDLVRDVLQHLKRANIDVQAACRRARDHQRIPLPEQHQYPTRATSKSFIARDTSRARIRLRRLAAE